MQIKVLKMQKKQHVAALGPAKLLICCLCFTKNVLIDEYEIHAGQRLAQPVQHGNDSWTNWEEATL